MSASDSYIIQDAHPDSSNEHDDIDSLPSSMDSSDLGSDTGSDAQREWEASIQQLELVMTMVIVPFVGKYFGRRFAYWSWAKYMEWLFPVEVRFTSKSTFKATGAAEALATL